MLLSNVIVCVENTLVTITNDEWVQEAIVIGHNHIRVIIKTLSMMNVDLFGIHTTLKVLGDERQQHLLHLSALDISPERQIILFSMKQKGIDIGNRKQNDDMQWCFWGDPQLIQCLGVIIGRDAFIVEHDFKNLLSFQILDGIEDAIQA